MKLMLGPSLFGESKGAKLGSHKSYFKLRPGLAVAMVI